jgi:hypothetical protein
MYLVALKGNKHKRHFFSLVNLISLNWLLDELAGNNECRRQAKFKVFPFVSETPRHWEVCGRGMGAGWTRDPLWTLLENIKISYTLNPLKYFQSVSLSLSLLRYQSWDQLESHSESLYVFCGCKRGPLLHSCSENKVFTPINQICNDDLYSSVSIPEVKGLHYQLEPIWYPLLVGGLPLTHTWVDLSLVSVQLRDILRSVQWVNI